MGRSEIGKLKLETGKSKSKTRKKNPGRKNRVWGG
jgi:hypothetical protein